MHITLNALFFFSSSRCLFKDFSCLHIIQQSYVIRLFSSEPSINFSWTGYSVMGNWPSITKHKHKRDLMSSHRHKGIKWGHCDAILISIFGDSPDYWSVTCNPFITMLWKALNHHQNDHYTKSSCIKIVIERAAQSGKIALRKHWYWTEPII